MNQVTKRILFAFSFLAVIFFDSCTEKKTDDPIETYKLWSGEYPQKNIEIIHGRYWQSAHWTKEYIMYMELIAPGQWRAQFVQQNKLVETSTRPAIPSDAPTWFTPGRNLRTFAPTENIQGSIICEDTLTGKMFIYEIQL
jgi:hypothetical protein